jgi:glucokinase
VQICPSESGESDFVARTADEWALREHLASTLGAAHIKVEHVVSGQGISRIYSFLRERDAGRRGGARKHKATDARVDDAAAAVEAAVRSAPDASAVIAAHSTPGDASADAHCVAAVDMFIDALGAEAANLAVRFQAHGGVYLAGGVTAKLANRLVSGGRLREAYLGKGRSTEAYRACPLYVVAVEGDDLGLEGVWAFAQSDRCGFRHVQA